MDLTQNTAENLRLEFDRAFGLPRVDINANLDDYITLRVTNVAYAVALLDVTGIASDCRITAVAGPVPSLLGITSVRNTLLPVYSLAGLLGYSVTTAPRWIIAARSHHPVAFAFDAFDGHLRIPREQRTTSADSVTGSPFTAGSIQTNEPRALINLSALIAHVTRLAGTNANVNPTTMDR